MTTSAEEAVSASAGAADVGERARAAVVQDDVRDVQDHIQGGSPRQIPGDLVGNGPSTGSRARRRRGWHRYTRG